MGGRGEEKKNNNYSMFGYGGYRPIVRDKQNILRQHFNEKLKTTPYCTKKQTIVFPSIKEHIWKKIYETINYVSIGYMNKTTV